ncbi:MAG TPA: ABC transporter substrate-binding protein [Streptosporangiaceae bacterium]
MTRQIHRIAALVTAGLAVAGLAACSSSGGGGGTAGGGGQPVKGGTLKLVAAGGPTYLDTVPAYYTANYILERTYARQLLSYPSVPDPTIGGTGWVKDTVPVPDIATAYPTVANGGLSKDGLTYTFHIRQGVDWSTSPPRQVVAADFVREFKAFCNTVAPVGNLPYYSNTISGLSQYCDQETKFFAKIKHPTAAQFANFQNSHNITGITTPNSSTIQFHLIKPAGDFPFELAMPFASARPVEADKYIPGSVQFDKHIVSDGPYKVSSYVPNRSITLVKNTAWNQKSDPIRHQYVNEITVTMGVDDAATQLADMQAGKFDMPLDTTINPSSYQQLISTHDPKFNIWPWISTVPYIAFNLRSPNAGHAMNNVKVRQAIEYAINKVAIQKVNGGPLVAKIINTAIPPGASGYQNYNPYPSKNSEGDPAKCKALLSQAGFKSGLKLNYAYQNDSVNAANFQAVQTSLKACGINLVGQPESGATFFTHVGTPSTNNKPGTFDMAQVGWIPDWFGGNNGRTVVDPFFRTNCVQGTINYGCYSNPQVDTMINQAEATPDLAKSNALWHQIDVKVMHDAVIIPLVSEYAPFYSSKNVENVDNTGEPSGSTAVVFAPNIGGPDLTNVYLKNG